MKSYSIRRKIAVYSVFLLGFLFAGTQVSAATVNVSSIAALQSAINSAAPGDIIILANGTYLNSTITIGTSGITVKAATPGGVYLNGTQAVVIDGNGNTFSGFQFTSGNVGSGIPITVNGSQNLLTQLNINGYIAQKYINLKSTGRSNVVAYCNFENKPTSAPIGNLIHIALASGVPGYHKIRYNSFQNMPGAGGDNGNECIRIENGAQSTYVGRNVVEYNYFNNTGLGDSEVVSVKCRENVLRYNTMTNNQLGNFCFRNGDNNVGYGNFFINSGGIRVKEANNIYCYNNYMENCGDGVVSAPIKYVYVSPNLKNINFFHNTIIGGSLIELDSGATGNTWANNIFKKTSGNIFSGSPSGISWAGNQYTGTLGISIPSGMTSVANPYLVLNSAGYYGLSSSSPAIDAASSSYPAILDIANVDDDPTLLMDISGQARPASAILKDVGCDEYGTDGTLNHPLARSDVGPSYLGGPGGANVAPSVTLTAPANGATFTAPASIAMTANASDSDGTVTTVGFYNGTTLLGSDTSSPYAYTWTNVAQGSYNLTARATDNSGATSTSAVATVTVNIPNAAPVFTADPINMPGATEDASYTGQTLSGSATDADGDTLTYSAQSGPSWLTVASSGALSGTPSNADVGSTPWTVLVSDGKGGTDTATLNITVANVNDAPVFTADPINKAAATVGVAYSQTLAGSATDVDAGATLTYSKVSGPAWLVVATTGALSGTPAAGDVGTIPWTVQVSDGLGGTDTAVLNITVTAASTTAPTFVAAGAIASGTGTIKPALPSGLAVGDILLLFVETANQAVSISAANGGTWAEITPAQGTGTAAGTDATRLTAFWSRYNGTQLVPTVSDSGNHQIARMIAIRGAAAAGDPWNVTSGGVEATSDTSASIPGATTTVDNTLVVVAVSGSLPDATSTAIFSGWSNANLTSLTERTDNAATPNNGGALGVATGVKATAGAIGNTTVTHSSAAVKGMMSIAIKN